MFSTPALASIVNIYANNFVIEPCFETRGGIASYDSFFWSQIMTFVHVTRNHQFSDGKTKEANCWVGMRSGMRRQEISTAGTTQLRKVLGLYHFLNETIRHSLESRPETPMKKSRLKIFNFVRSKYLTNKRENYRHVIKESECNSNWLQRLECVSNVGMCLTDFFCFFVYITSLYV